MCKDKRQYMKSFVEYMNKKIIKNQKKVLTKNGMADIMYELSRKDDYKTNKKSS